MFRNLIKISLILMLLCSTWNVTYGEGLPLRWTPPVVDETHPAPDGYYIYISDAPGINPYDDGTYTVRLDVPPEMVQRMIVACNKTAYFVMVSYQEATDGTRSIGPQAPWRDFPGTEGPQAFGLCDSNPPTALYFEVPPPGPSRINR